MSPRPLLFPKGRRRRGTRRVTITVTVEYDLHDWMLAYGGDTHTMQGLEAMDDDVAAYAASQLTQHFHMEQGTWARVSWQRAVRPLIPNRPLVHVVDSPAPSAAREA